MIPTNDIKTSFIDTLNNIYPLSKEIIAYLNEVLIIRKFKNDTILLNLGEVCTKSYYIVQGLGIVYLNQNDKSDLTVTRFSPPGGLLQAPVSFITQQPSIEGIKVLGPSILIEISHSSLQYLYINHPTFNFIGRYFTEKYYLLSEQRNFILRRRKAVDKWKWFQDNYDYVLKRRDIPQAYIASFLGISREHLNKIQNCEKVHT